MTNHNEWLKVLNLARSNSAQDLNLSNEILLVVDELVRSAERQELTNERVTELSAQLVNVAIKLTNQSKSMSMAVGKLVGAA
jgi:hypothetical protein